MFFLNRLWSGVLLFSILTPVVVLVDAQAQDVRKSHAAALYGEPGYPEGFSHFAYVDPQAPKGGTLHLAALGTYDSFNPYIAHGIAAPMVGAETLMVASADEPFTNYGLIAESLEWPEDRTWVVFNLHEEATWPDGVPISAQDVVFSLEALRTHGNPSYKFYYQDVLDAEILSSKRVKFFLRPNNRELILILGQLPILPAHYWAERDFSKTTLEPPLYSGPYQVESFEAGRHLVLRRDPDYWGWSLPAMQGQQNFDRIRIDFYRDTTAMRQALKSGDVDYRLENVSKAWATEYDIKSVREGRLVKEEVQHNRPAGMQGFFFNTRRWPFGDRRVREALGYAFDFEWTNQTLFYGQYLRTESYFANSELAATGLPQGEELKLLERFSTQLDPRVFSQPWKAPFTEGGEGRARENIRHALQLLRSAGFVVQDGVMVEAETQRPLRFEIMLAMPSFERVVLPFADNLKRLGIEMRVRLVDIPQYTRRVRSYDFDMIVGGIGQSESPGNEQRLYWSSAAAQEEGGSNYAGISDPVIDALVDDLIASPDRRSLVSSARALDRVLLWGFYVIPNWHLNYDRLLWWNKFSRPVVLPDRGTSTSYWWYDEAKAAVLSEQVEQVE